MNAIVEYFDSLGLNFWQLLQMSAILLLGTFLISIFARFVFGKRSTLSCAVSSAIAILFIYAVTVVLHSLGARFESFVAPLPFVSISGNYLSIFVFQGAHYTAVCSEVLSMIILAFLVNMADDWLPDGKNVLSWVFFRCVTVLLALVLHLLVVWLFATYLPEGIVVYAPTVLLCLLILMLMTGSLKFIIGALISTSSPIIGGLYTFFFATAVGKRITKAILTAAILSAIVLLLNYTGCTAVYIASSALIAYIPFVILLVVIWYVESRVL